MHQSSMRKSVKRRKQRTNAGKRLKRRPKSVINKQINQWSMKPKLIQLMDQTIQRIDEQFRSVEIKMAIKQFMTNQLLDQLQLKGILNEEEIKSIYSNTYRFWKEDLREEGDPFRNINLDEMPILQFYRMKQDDLSLRSVEGRQELYPERQSDPNKPVFNSSESREIKSYVSQLKEEVKGLKKDRIKQRNLDFKQQFLPQR